MSRSILNAFLCLALFASPAFAQETAVEKETVTAKKAITQVALNEEGQLVGSAFVAGEETPLKAKMTLATQDGVVIDTVEAKEDGSFAFASVAPGTYNMYGSSANYVAAQTFDVLPAGGGGCSACSVGMTSYSPTVYESYASAPVSSCGTCGGCGCGGGGLFGGGGIGGRLGGRLGGGFGGGGGGLLGGGGGGLLGGAGGLARLGLIGGVVAIATSGDDASPAQ